jgi:RimJ/RimL family protein N-acetyltransferase
MLKIKSIIHNGYTFYCRFVTIQDKDILLNAFNKFSSLSRYYRFHSTKKALTPKDINYFLNLDNDNHLAIGLLEKNNNEEQGIGIIRYIRDVKNPSNAEVGLGIIDSHQNKGIGIELYKRLLYYAKRNGIKTLTNSVLSDNIHMIKLLRKLDGITKKHLSGVLEIVVTVK